MKTKFVISTLLLITITLSSFSTNETLTKTNELGKWTILGKRTVNMKADHDEILVGAYKGTFKRLRFKVIKAPIFVKNVKIIYGNGFSENHVINRRFKKGNFSNILDLKGGKRVIKKIVFNYRTLRTGKGRAHIIAFGKH